MCCQSVIDFEFFFSFSEQLQAEIAASKGMTFLINCAQHASPTTAVYALAALSNVAASEEGTAVLMSSLDVRALSRHLTENKEHSDAAQHIARMFANIASHRMLFLCFDNVVLLMIGKLLQPSTCSSFGTMLDPKSSHISRMPPCSSNHRSFASSVPLHKTVRVFVNSFFLFFLILFRGQCCRFVAHRVGLGSYSLVAQLT